MEDSKDTKRGQQNQDKPDYPFVQSQLTRLGFFLTASSFLVVAFITLVTADKGYVLLIHAVAGLGSSIAVGYTFMNWWLIRDRKEQLLHTWVIPLLFFVFWILAWLSTTNSWFVLIMILAFPLLWLYQRRR